MPDYLKIRGPMPDGQTMHGPADRIRIKMDEPHEVLYWTQTLNCTEAELRRAISDAGALVGAVRRHLPKIKKLADP